MEKTQNELQITAELTKTGIGFGQNSLQVSHEIAQDSHNREHTWEYLFGTIQDSDDVQLFKATGNHFLELERHPAITALQSHSNQIGRTLKS